MQPLSIHHTCCHQQLLTHQFSTNENIDVSMSTTFMDENSSSHPQKHHCHHHHHKPPSLSSSKSPTMYLKLEELNKQTESICVKVISNKNHSKLHVGSGNYIPATEFHKDKVQFVDSIDELSKLSLLAGDRAHVSNVNGLEHVMNMHKFSYQRCFL